MAGEFQVSGQNAAALFTLKLHRGDGMTLVAMNWKKGKPPKDFRRLRDRVQGAWRRQILRLEESPRVFPVPRGTVDPNRLSTRRSPIQKFRWVHFPRNAEAVRRIPYRVTPVFMNDADELSYGEHRRPRSSSGARPIRDNSMSPSPAASCRRRRSWIDTYRAGHDFNPAPEKGG